jgi:nucleotide-binding universal stress UspA family protein
MSTYNGEPGAIVCGVDSSLHARAVAALAASFADRLGLRVRFVHSPSADVSLIGEGRRAAIARGAALLDAFGTRHDERIVRLGPAADVLADAITDQTAFAVVGSRGLGAARAALLGSVSRALAGCAPCPVIVVPPSAEVDLAAEPTIVCGLDGSTAAISALRSAAALAHGLDVHLLVVHVRPATPAQLARSIGGPHQPFVEPLDAARAAVAIVERPVAELDPGVPTTMRIESGDAAAGLARVAAEAGPGVVVVGAHRHGLLRSALLGSVSLHLAATSPVPVMIVPPTRSPTSDRSFQGRGVAAPTPLT